jgi:hypothetical protein
MIEHDDGLNKMPQRVASYCKQETIFLPLIFHAVNTNLLVNKFIFFTVIKCMFRLFHGFIITVIFYVFRSVRCDSIVAVWTNKYTFLESK